MTRIVGRQTQPHVCLEANGYGGAGDRELFFQPPGTIVECDCGTTWVAERRRPGEGWCRWRRERRGERRRRERLAVSTGSAEWEARKEHPHQPQEDTAE